MLQQLYELHHQQGNRAGFSYNKHARAQFFKHHIGSGKHVLDIGCRDGALTQYYLEKNFVTGADIDSNLLKFAKQKGIKTVHLDVYQDWPFKQKFDVIVAGEILEHLYYPEQIIAKAYKCLQPKGKLLVSVPNAYIVSARVRFLLGQEIPAHQDPTHINLFSEKKLYQMLKKQFRKVEISGIAPPLYKLIHRLSNSWFSDNLLAVGYK